MTTNLFEAATRQKLRFPSGRGDLSAEDLWDLPLTARNGFDLDNIAKAVNRDLKETAEESFVNPAPTSAQSILAMKLDIVKHIIAVKIKEADDAKHAAARAAERARLVAALDQKNEQELLGMSKEDIQKRLTELGA